MNSGGVVLTHLNQMIGVMVKPGTNSLALNIAFANVPMRTLNQLNALDLCYLHCTVQLNPDPPTGGFDFYCSIYFTIMFNSYQPGWRVWYRRTNDSQPLWNTMSYSPRPTEADALNLVEFYEDEWGNHYEYAVMPCGQRPRGMCVPYV